MELSVPIQEKVAAFGLISILIESVFSDFNELRLLSKTEKSRKFIVSKLYCEALAMWMTVFHLKATYGCLIAMTARFALGILKWPNSFIAGRRELVPLTALERDGKVQEDVVLSSVAALAALSSVAHPWLSILFSVIFASFSVYKGYIFAKRMKFIS